MAIAPMGTIDVPGEPEQLRARRHPGELGHRVEHVGDQQRDQDVEGHLDAEVLADEVGEAFARDDRHADAHLLDDDQGDEYGDHHPQQAVAVVRAGQRVGGDAARVVVHVGRDDARADHGKEEEDAVARDDATEDGADPQEPLDWRRLPGGRVRPRRRPDQAAALHPPRVQAS